MYTTDTRAGLALPSVCSRTQIEIFEAVGNHIRGCSCASGCPACIQSPTCLLDNDELDKQMTIDLLSVL